MNQRIRELHSQCKVCDKDTVLYFDYEKFAELIVRECAEVCYEHSFHAGGIDTHFGYGYKDCGDDIKRNFGVDESKCQAAIDAARKEKT